MSNFEKKILSFLEKYILWIAGAILLFLSLLARKNVLFFLSGDMKAYLISWYYQILDHKGLPSLAHRIGNYNIPYHFLMALISYWKGEAMYRIKYLSIAFDYLLAFACMRVVMTAAPKKQSNRNLLGFCTFFLVLALPTVFLNSAVWGQCDAIFTSFLVFSVLWFLRDKPWLGMVFYGLALCFKLQAIFLLPAVLLYYFCSRKFSVLNFLIIPGMMVLTSLPGVYYGRSFFDFLEIYKEQTITYPYLTMDCPNIYCFVPNEYRLFSLPGIILTLGILLTGYVFIIRYQQKKPYGFADYLRFAIWTSFTCTMFLPAMHERYGFPTEILLVVYTLIFGEMFFESAALIVVAVLAYVPFLLDFTPVPLTVVAVFNMAMYCLISWKFFQRSLSPRVKAMK